MRHRVTTKHFNRPADHRRAMYRNLVASLVKSGSIKTTIAKAKAIRPLAEKIFTQAKPSDLNARRRLQAFFYEEAVVEKVLKDLVPLYRSRSGGYLRIVKLGKRLSDNTEVARLEFVDKPAEKPKTALRRRRQTEKPEKTPEVVENAE